MTNGPFAHSAGFSGKWEPIKDHLLLVSELAAKHAEAFGASEEARLAGLCHDLGKVGLPFQKVLFNQARGVDHWSFGARVLLNYLKDNGRASILAVLGHHMGIPKANKNSFRAWLCPSSHNAHPLGLSLSPPSFDPADGHLATAGVSLPPAPAASWVPNQMFRDEPARAMLRTRALFSALVDADFIATERHFIGTDCRPAGLPLEPSRLWEAFQSLLKEKRAASCDTVVRRVREEVLESCLEAANSTCSLQTLTAPTGSGKTLAMLAFALRRAMDRRHRRIILVLPYLTLIQEVHALYRSLIKLAYPGELPDLRLIEDHSLAPTGQGDADGASNDTPGHRRLIENWDAPIILTTNVQFLESLHSNRPSRCRKLHNVADSVILLDEVQTIPRELAPLTLASLSTLAYDLKCSVMLATATQPAFQSLHDAVVRHFSLAGWSPSEVIRKPARLFAALRRVEIEWASLRGPWSVDDLAEKLLACPRVLCILNLKRHARCVYSALAASDPNTLFLSTQLCPAHREEVLNLVKRQPPESSLRLVSTQCVEAGVDLDFPAVFRAFGPLEALAQAAGRCNRHGNLNSGRFVVFELSPDSSSPYPDHAYSQAAQVTQILLRERQDDFDLFSPSLFDEYYAKLFSIDRDHLAQDPLTTSVKTLDFPQIAEKYRLIPQSQINVLVPYEAEAFDLLRNEVLQTGLTAAWIRRVRPYSVAVFRPPADAPVWSSLESVPLRPKGECRDWFVLRDPSLYHPVLGFTLPSNLSFLEC